MSRKYNVKILTGFEIEIDENIASEEIFKNKLGLPDATLQLKGIILDKICKIIPNHKDVIDITMHETTCDIFNYGLRNNLAKILYNNNIRSVRKLIEMFDKNEIFPHCMYRFGDASYNEIVKFVEKMKKE